MMVTMMRMTTSQHLPKRKKPSWALAIELRRTALQLSQELVAERAEMSQSYYSDVERGAKPLLTLTAGKLLSLARALNWLLMEMQAATGIDLGSLPIIPLPSINELKLIRNFGNVSTFDPAQFKYVDNLTLVGLDDVVVADVFAVVLDDDAFLTPSVPIEKGRGLLIHEKLTPRADDVVFFELNGSFGLKLEKDPADQMLKSAKHIGVVIYDWRARMIKI